MWSSINHAIEKECSAAFLTQQTIENAGNSLLNENNLPVSTAEEEVPTITRIATKDEHLRKNGERQFILLGPHDNSRKIISVCNYPLDINEAEIPTPRHRCKLSNEIGSRKSETPETSGSNVSVLADDRSGQHLIVTMANDAALIATGINDHDAQKEQQKSQAIADISLGAGLGPMVSSYVSGEIPEQVRNEEVEAKMQKNEPEET